MTKEQAQNRAEEIRFLIRTGKMDYKTGRAELAEIFSVLDEEGKKIAKKYGMRHKPLSINAFLR